jgi:hypothetical protein
MADFIVSVNALLKRKTVQCVPEPLEVNPSDTVQWGSFHGDVEILFDTDKSPFEKPDWSAVRGTLSKTAHVQDVKGRYECAVTVYTDAGPITGHSIVVIPSTDR